MKKHSEEFKLKMSLEKKGTYIGSANPNFGKKQSKATCIKMVLNNSKTKLTPEDILKIKEVLLDGENHESIAIMFGVSRTVITRISNGTRWSNITGGPIAPVIYKNGKRCLSEDHRKKIGSGRQGKLHTEESKEKMRQSIKRRNYARR